MSFCIVSELMGKLSEISFISQDLIPFYDFSVIIEALHAFTAKEKRHELELNSLLHR